jgi:hypothetical protein
MTHSKAIALAMAGFLAGAAPLAQAACEGERVDGTTADFAMKKAKAAGYQKLTGLKKGCDSVWHGKAMKDGTPVNLAITPKGEVLEEGN